MHGIQVTMQFISIGRSRCNARHLLERGDLVTIQKILSNRCIMLSCERIYLQFGMFSDDRFDDLVSLWSKLKVRNNEERKHRSRIQSVYVENMRVMFVVDQYTQSWVRFSLLESLNAYRSEVGYQMRVLILEIL